MFQAKVVEEACVCFEKILLMLLLNLFPSTLLMLLFLAKIFHKDFQGFMAGQRIETRV